jgi:hypothetical protein
VPKGKEDLMASRSITIRVSPQAAQAYRKTSPEERRKLDALLSLKLHEITSPPRPLEQIMSEISRKAQERGLTPKILDDLLDDR